MILAVTPWCPTLMNLLGGLLFVVVPAVLAAEVLRCLYLEYRSDRIPILLYHRLVSKADAKAGRVADDEMIWVSYDAAFAEQMAYLREAGYTALDFDDYVNIRSGRMPLPPKPVIITLDDGYLSSYTMAYPVLKKHGLKAAVFVAPQPDQHTRDLVKGVDGFLTDQQMREMSDNGISIQSHTLTHCILSELADEQVLHELNESRSRLAAVTGRPVDHIAIPRSGYSRRVRGLVARVGYKTACCNNKGSANGRSDPLALPRVVIERDMSIDDFARCLRPLPLVVLRIVGNIKRVPEFVGGAHSADLVRDCLYRGPLLTLFRTRNLKKLIAACGVLYLLATGLFLWHLITA